MYVIVTCLYVVLYVMQLAVCIYVAGFHITRLPHTQNQTYVFTRNGLLA